MNSEISVVYVVDDDEEVLRALRRLLHSAGLMVQTFASARDFLRGAQSVGHGCLLLDLQMPQLSGRDLQSELAARGVQIPIIFLSGHGDIPTAVQAVKDGAVDFLAKPYRASQLLSAIRAALEKDQQRRQNLADQEQVLLRFGSLTQREREVLTLVVAGRLNKQIAAELGNCERTVKVHRARVMQKMRAGSVAELARMVERSGLNLPPVQSGARASA